MGRFTGRKKGAQVTKNLFPLACSILPLLLAAAPAARAAAPPSSAAALQEKALQYRAASLERFRSDLLELAAVPSISALPAHAADVLAAAEWLRAKLTSIGLSSVKVLPTAGPQPVVYAEHSAAAADAPAILIYGHYDVQPVDPLSLWDAPPFEPAVKGGAFWGRGVDDDKGGLVNAVHALESYLKGAGGLPVNVKLLLEGQEEIGSPNLAAFLEAHRALFEGVDVAISADGGQISETQPAISTGLRGAVALQVDIRTAGTDLHSGMKGGSVQNSAHALIELLATLRDPKTGRVLVAGFYDGVTEPTEDDKKDMERYPLDAEAEMEALGVKGLMGEEGRTTLERRWYRPTLEIVGMSSGFNGDGIKTIVPAAATAKLSARLVPGQRPADVAEKIKAHLEKHQPQLTDMTVKVLGFRADPWTSPRSTPANQAAARVLERVMGAEPLFVKDGGTVPALAYFDAVLGVPSTVFAFCLGDHIHAPNERLKVSMFDLGSKGWVELLGELGHGGRRPFLEARGEAGHEEL